MCVILPDEQWVILVPSFGTVETSSEAIVFKCVNRGFTRKRIKTCKFSKKLPRVNRIAQGVVAWTGNTRGSLNVLCGNHCGLRLIFMLNQGGAAARNSFEGDAEFYS